MARFYLHLHSWIGVAPDEEVRQGRVDSRGHIDIVNEAQEMCCRVPFSSAIEIQLDEPT